MPERTVSAPCSRYTTVQALFATARSTIFDLLNQPHASDAERKAAFALMTQSAIIGKDLETFLADVSAVRQIEYDRIRPLISSLRSFALRDHLTLIAPFWGWSAVTGAGGERVNSVAFVGDEHSAVHDSMVGICHERDLKLTAPGSALGVGRQRWTQLRESEVALFDLSTEDPVVRASACYSLGAALVLGVIPVLVTRRERPLPFNIDMAPVQLGGDDRRRLAQAIDRALYSNHTPLGRSSVQETCRKLFALLTSADATTQVLKRRFITNGEALDAVQARQISEQLLGLNGRQDLGVVCPVWPAAYPEHGDRRCFHVMPFSQPWSDDARNRVEEGCKHAGVRYRRGDETGEQRVVESIWEEIAKATRVVVDLTGRNENVAMELGIAHALGRRTLPVVRDPPAQVDRSKFPEIATLQIRSYEGSGDTLSEMTREFLEGPSDDFPG